MSGLYEPDFSADERHALAELLGLTEPLGPGSVASRGAVPINELRRVLDLPEPGLHQVLANDRWLCGGAVLRWIGHGRLRPDHTGDFDYFMPSLEVVNRSVGELTAAGYRFRCFRARQGLCFLCGRPAQPSGFDRTLESVQPFPLNHCPSCGVVEQDDPRLVEELPLELTPERVRDRQIQAVELLAPGGEQIHLVTNTLEPSLAATVARADFSVAQFGLDSENLHFGPHAWCDLLLSRCRLVDRKDSPRNSYFRLRRYQARGLRPYLETVVVIYSRVLARKLRNLLP